MLTYWTYPSLHLDQNIIIVKKLQKLSELVKIVKNIKMVKNV